MFTATKIIWTSFREDAAKFAGSMQVKPEEILNLPQFTFGMHNRKRGFVPIRGVPNALADYPRREGPGALKREMEARYGSSTDEPSGDDQPNDPPTGGNDSGPSGQPGNGENEPPDVEII